MSSTALPNQAISGGTYMGVKADGTITFMVSQRGVETQPCKNVPSTFTEL